MTVQELSETWRPDGNLVMAAHIVRSLVDLAGVSGFTPVADVDDFSAFHALHLVTDGTPVVLLEYDRTSGYVYVLAGGHGAAVESAVTDVLGFLGVMPSEVPWTTWAGQSPSA